MAQESKSELASPVAVMTTAWLRTYKRREALHFLLGPSLAELLSACTVAQPGMDDAIHHIQAAPPTDEGHEKLHKSLSDHEDQLRSLGTVDGENGPVLLEGFNSLSLPEHTLGAIHLLAGQSHSLEARVQPAFAHAVSRLLTKFDPKQASKAGKKFVQVVHKYTSISVQHPIMAFVPLRTGANRFAPRPSCLTPLHTDFLEIALLAKLYKQAAQFIDSRPVYEVDPRATGLVTVDMLRYFYYGGMVFVGVKRYNDALDFFKTAVTVPANALSAVAVEAYKKLLLVSCLVPGREPEKGREGEGPKILPKYTSNVVSRNIRHAAQPYQEIVAAAQEEDTEKCQKLFEKHQETLSHDNNLGLAKQVLSNLVVRKIRKLTRTFVTLSLDDIAKHAGLSSAAAAEKRIVDLVDSGAIVAQVDEVTGMVYFAEDKPENYSSAQNVARLDKELHVVMELAESVQRLDTRISTTPAYVSKSVGGRGLAQGAGGGGSESHTPDFDDDVEAAV